MSDAAEEQTIEDGGNEEQNQVNPAEQKARDAGWVAEDEWKGESGTWVDYKDFNFRGELMGRISEQSSIISHLEDKVHTRDKVIEDFSELKDKITEREYKRALADLKAKKVQALDEDNSAMVVDLDEEITELKTRKPKPEPAKSTQQIPPDTPKEVVQWLDDPKNAWYNKDDLMHSIADGISNNIMRKNPNITPAALLNQLDETIRKELPHKFQSASAVDDGGSQYSKASSTTTRLPSFGSLSEEQQQVGKRFVKLGLMTRKEYVEELVKNGDA